MKTKALLVTLALCLATGTACFAANTQMGMWKLNVKKSKLGNGKARNNTVVYSSMLFQTKVITDGTNEKGQPAHSEWTGQFDGKDYAVTGDPTSDMRSYRKIDDRTMDFTAKKGGKVTLSGRIVVGDDGKGRTEHVTGTNSKGKKFHSVAVYDKAG